MNRHETEEQLCPVCGATMPLAFRHALLSRPDIGYHFCADCGLLRTEEPNWLEEAYGQAIASSDTGLLRRNISICLRLAPLLHYLCPGPGPFLDYAGGYGVLVRLMRDLGFDFRRYDRYCANVFAAGFEHRPGTRYAAATAFEILEHVHDPTAFLPEILDASQAEMLVTTTVLFDGPPPGPDWWYYSFRTGQHITFYRRDTLERLAANLDLHFVSNGFFHVFSRRPIDRMRFRLFASRAAALTLPLIMAGRRSLTVPDSRAALGE